MKTDKTTLLKRILVTTIGCFILGFGIGLLVVSDLGGDPATVFVTALAGKFPQLTVGNWNAIFCLVMVILTLIVDRKQIGYTTVFYTLFGQLTVDLAINMVKVPATLFGKILVLLLSIIVISIAVAMFKATDLGFSAFDAIIVALSGRFNKSYKVVRWTLDPIFLVTGYFLGGKIGIGTIICLLILGYAIDFFMKILTPPIKKLVYKAK